METIVQPSVIESTPTNIEIGACRYLKFSFIMTSISRAIPNSPNPAGYLLHIPIYWQFKISSLEIYPPKILAVFNTLHMFVQYLPLFIYIPFK